MKIFLKTKSGMREQSCELTARRSTLAREAVGMGRLASLRRGGWQKVVVTAALLVAIAGCCEQPKALTPLPAGKYALIVFQDGSTLICSWGEARKYEHRKDYSGTVFMPVDQPVPKKYW